MKKIMLVAFVLSIVLVSFTFAENVSPDALLAKIQEKIRAQNILLADDLGKFMETLRKEYENRKNISLKAYTLEQRTRLMLQEGPIADAAKDMAQLKINVQEQAKIALAASIAVAKGADAGEVRKTVRTMAQNQVQARVCLMAMEEIGLGDNKIRGMNQVRLMTEEMVKLGLKGDGLVAAVREMVSLMNSGETPRQARLTVMTQVKAMIKSGTKEDKLAANLQVRTRERARLMKEAEEKKMRQEIRQEQQQGGGTGGTKSEGAGGAKKGR